MVLKTPINNSVKIRSTVSESEKLCRSILDNLKKSGFSQQDIFAVHLALEEALSNAIRHGNRMDKSKNIYVDYTVEKDRVEIDIRDEGQGFSPEDVPDPRCGDNIYKAGGRGLFLMKAYMNQVEFCDSGNCLRMVRFKQKEKQDKNQQ
jgi:serine/threonine-protein kinase RsbW